MGSKHSSPVFNLSTFLWVCVRLHQRISLPTDSNTFAVIIFQSCCQRGAYLSVWKMKNFTVPSNSAWPTPTMMMDMGSLAACRETNNKQIKGCVLKDENRIFFQLAERPLRRTGEEKWGMCYGGEWGGRGLCLLPDWYLVTLSPFPLIWILRGSYLGMAICVTVACWLSGWGAEINSPLTADTQITCKKIDSGITAHVVKPQKKQNKTRQKTLPK